MLPHSELFLQIFCLPCCLSLHTGMAIGNLFIRNLLLYLHLWRVFKFLLQGLWCIYAHQCICTLLLQVFFLKKTFWMAFYYKLGAGGNRATSWCWKNATGTCSSEQGNAHNINVIPTNSEKFCFTYKIVGKQFHFPPFCYRNSSRLAQMHHILLLRCWKGMPPFY